MIDQYKAQYKKETEQIHAPAELIARTKAAVREEEARILQGTAAQAAESDKREMSAVSEAGTVCIGDRKYEGRFGRWKWAYPLTAAAALLILVSVSMTMGALNSGNMNAESSVYEEAAADMEAEGMSGGADSDGGMTASGITAEVEESMETAKEVFVDEEECAEADLAAVSEAVSETEDLAEPGAAVEDTSSDKSMTTERSEQERKFSDEKKDSIKEEALPVENMAQSSGTADAENITIKKVAGKPDFCENPDIEIYVFEGETFQVAMDDNQWAAYVETKEGGKYVIRGEAENMEAFLEAGYRKVTEMKEK